MTTLVSNLPDDAVWTSMETPVGELYLIASSSGLHAVLWESDFKNFHLREKLKRLTKDNAFNILKETVTQLKEYFAGKRTKFEIPLAPCGTEFQMKAWTELQKIPYGKTISYSEQAARMGDKKKARAVGTANSRNPISIVVPCHRVIANDGRLSGFGGGVSNKQLLLDLEKRHGY